LSLVVLLRMQMVGHGLPGAAKQNVPYGVAIAAGGLYVAMRISSL